MRTTIHYNIIRCKRRITDRFLFFLNITKPTERIVLLLSSLETNIDRLNKIHSRTKKKKKIYLNINSERLLKSDFRKRRRTIVFKPMVIQRYLASNESSKLVNTY